jgi:hypothetical protein
MKSCFLAFECCTLQDCAKMQPKQANRRASSQYDSFVKTQKALDLIVKKVVLYETEISESASKSLLRKSL